MAWRQCPMCHGNRSIIKDGHLIECRYCRGLGKVYDSPPTPFAASPLFATLLQVSAAIVAGYIAATYNKHWEPTHNLILGAMVAVATYWLLTLKAIRELGLLGLVLLILYQIYQAWLQH